jgi:cytochrome b561
MRTGDNPKKGVCQNGTPVLSGTLACKDSLSLQFFLTYLVFFSFWQQMSAVQAATYSRTASAFHWAVAVPMMGSVCAVLQAQRLPNKSEERQFWMRQHESLGLLSAMILVPRVAYRVLARSTAYNVVDLPGTKPIERMAASTMYVALHGFGIVLSVTGVTMNYYGGWGLPFFWTKFEGLPRTEENKEKYGPFAYQMYSIHKQVGAYGKYLIPLHIAGSTTHVVKGQAIFSRINPFHVPKG